ncbi:MAG: rod shape-determining protein MreC [Helicobacteraceae bacterium CG2_30_36_10]|nr:MAG: rod shape-determining protein MreC [Helicobacteraceae bacterium CG2_30_36_10]
MNKGLLSFLLVFIALFLGALYYSSTLQSPFISSLNKIKSTYHNTIEFIEEKINQHIFQAKHIEELNEKLNRYENNHLVMQQLASEINDLFQENNSSLKTNPKVELVRAISYAKFGDLNRIWLEIPDYNSSKIYGLIYKELVAGIVISEHKKPLALLNRDIQSSYAVYVGETKAPGIVHGNNAKNLLVKFIPAWYDIKVDDEVVTSGLDKIFFKDLKVGKVLSVKKSQGYQDATIEPYYEADDPNYFHIIRSVR